MGSGGLGKEAEGYFTHLTRIPWTRISSFLDKPIRGFAAAGGDYGSVIDPRCGLCGVFGHVRYSSACTLRAQLPTLPRRRASPTWDPSVYDFVRPAMSHLRRR